MYVACESDLKNSPWLFCSQTFKELVGIFKDQWASSTTSFDHLCHSNCSRGHFLLKAFIFLYLSCKLKLQLLITWKLFKSDRIWKRDILVKYRHGVGVGWAGKSVYLAHWHQHSIDSGGTLPLCDLIPNFSDLVFYSSPGNSCMWDIAQIP